MKLSELYSAPTKVNAKDYTWTVLSGLSAIRRFSNGKKEIGPIIINNLQGAREFKNPLSSISHNYVEEAILFDDETILVAISISEWIDTMASHENIRVEYYGGIPKKKSS